MRPQQQNRRMRGRGGNNRKGPNPLTRSYESNGPDVKIRGTAQQVADKYSTLARDAQSSGDRVMAENYLQHAEHYNRLIAAAQAQQQQQQQPPNGRDAREDSDEEIFERDETDAAEAAGGQQRRGFDDGSGPQPVIPGVPAEVALKEQPSRSRRQNGRHAEAADGGGDEAGGGAANGAPEPEAAQQEEAKPARRTRRARPRKADNDAAETAGDEPGETPKTERTEEATAQG